MLNNINTEEVMAVIVWQISWCFDALMDIEVCDYIMFNQHALVLRGT
ncbi:hypothetical protein [Shewanella sp. TB4-MNA-CIBAN-0142]